MCQATYVHEVVYIIIIRHGCMFHDPESCISTVTVCLAASILSSSMPSSHVCFAVSTSLSTMYILPYTFASGSSSALQDKPVSISCIWRQGKAVVGMDTSVSADMCKVLW